MKSQDKFPSRLENLIWREVDDGLVIVSPTAGKVRVLNTVGKTIWELLDGEHSVEALQTALMAQFSDIPAEQIEKDVKIFLEDLTSKGLVVWQ